MKYELESADNGWIISWWSDESEEMVQHHQVFEIPDEIDTNKEDPQALIDLLYFVKETVCNQFYSKHKNNNIMVRFEDGEDVLEQPLASHIIVESDPTTAIRS